MIPVRVTFPLRAVLLAVLGAAPWALAVAGDAHEAMHGVFTLLLVIAPVLVAFALEREPAPDRTPHARGRVPLAVRFPFLAGGSCGAVFLVLALAVSAAGNALVARVEHGAWFAHDDPLQLLFAALYAIAFVLVPAGLCAPLLHRRAGRVLAAAGILAAPIALAQALSPEGPRGPAALTEVGHPGRMVGTVLRDGRLTGHAGDDVAALVALAALGAVLNVPRIVRRWRALAAAGPVTAP